MNELVGFMGGILLEASFLLALDKSLDYQGFYPYVGDSEQKFDYLASAYFVIVSFSTIGYGDIHPDVRLIRFVMVVVIIINITVMSNFLGRLIEHIFQLSPYNKYYDFKDHVVIIGNLPEEKVFNFLEEIIENDIIEKNANLVNSLGIGIKIIIVLDNDPSSSLIVTS